MKYLDHLLTDDGLLPDADKIRAIQDMPCSKSTTDVRRFLGMAAYLGQFIHHLSQVTAPLRQLAKANQLGCTKELESAFSIAKEGVTAAFQKLAYFRPSPAVCSAISCDASPLGLGAMLWQQSDREQCLPVAAASRSLNRTESRYSQLEREMLSVVSDITRFR